MKRSILTTLVASSLVAGSAANAVVLSISGGNSNQYTSGAQSGLGAFNGTFEYSYNGGTTATINVSLTNTSNASNGGYITALAFNNPFQDMSRFDSGNPNSGFSDGYLTSGTLSVNSNNSTWQILPSDGNLVNTGDEVSGNPFGYFDLGAAAVDSGGNFDWVGSGQPNGGIGVGETSNFVFTVTGDANDLALLTSESFFSDDSLSEGNGAGGGYQNFAVRFRGFDNGGSDKVVIGPDEGSVVNPVPEPSTYAMFGIAFAILGFVGYRKRHAA